MRFPNTAHTRFASCLLALTWHVAVSTAAPTISIHADHPGGKINPAMWGVFFEDINFGADGGLYAELVKNRGFEFPDPLMGWSKLASDSGKLEIREESPFNQVSP